MLLMGMWDGGGGEGNEINFFLFFSLREMWMVLEYMKGGFKLFFFFIINSFKLI